MKRVKTLLIHGVRLTERRLAGGVGALSPGLMAVPFPLKEDLK